MDRLENQVAKVYYSRRTKFALSIISIAVLLSGCATTTSSSSDWSARNIGQGIQHGAIASYNNPLSGIVWGIGFLVEHVGVAVESTASPAHFEEDAPE